MTAALVNIFWLTESSLCTLIPPSFSWVENSFYWIPAVLTAQNHSNCLHLTLLNFLKLHFPACEDLNVQCGFKEPVNSLRPPFYQGLMVKYAPCCRIEPYTEVCAESGWHSWRGAHAARGIMCAEEKKNAEFFSWRDLKGRRACTHTQSRA